MNTPQLSHDGRNIVIRIPYRFRRKQGRKEIIAPEGEASPFLPPIQPDEKLIKALAQGFHWRRLLESGKVETIRKLAAEEKVDPAHIGRMLRVTLLAPDIIEAILDGRQPEGVSIRTFRKTVPADWVEQRAAWGFPQPQA
ncbi:MAG: hypothetical protein HQL53_08605 [Magnetococcales bacterium]|nr:hypothetical protein [Magnetococcales bacterium]